jgi:DNA repair exonuclease SbcCD nuclease subunit
MVRFLHSSDWQLGMRRHFLDADAQARFSQARIDAIRRLGRVANEEQCAFIVVAGDVFESNHLDPRTIGRAVEALRTMSLPVYLLPGNHDPLDAASIFLRPEFASGAIQGVHVLSGEPAVAMPGVEIHGVPWRSKRPATDLVAEYCSTLIPADGTTVRILVAHGAVSSFSAGRTDLAIIDETTAEAALAERRIDYLALGDRHSATSIGSTGRIWYSGAPEPTDFDERNPGKALVVDVEPGRCEVREVPIGEWQFLLHEADLNSLSDVEALRAELDRVDTKERSILKLSLRGTLSIEAKAALDAMLGDMEQVFASVNTWERHTDLVVVPDDHDFASISVGGYARDALEWLMEQARSDNGDGEAVRDALALLHRLSGSSP